MSPDNTELAALMGKIAAGDDRALRSLYEKTSPFLLGHLLHMLRSRELAEEVLQDSYLRVWRRGETYLHAKGGVLSWLMTVARNRAIDILRQRRVSQELATDIEPDEILNTIADDTEDVEHRSQMRQFREHASLAMAKLSAGERSSIALAYFEGLSITEVAEHLGVPLGTAKSWVRRGLLKMKDELPGWDTARTATSLQTTGLAATRGAHRQQIAHATAGRSTAQAWHAA